MKHDKKETQIHETLLIVQLCSMVVCFFSVVFLVLLYFGILKLNLVLY